MDLSQDQSKPVRPHGRSTRSTRSMRPQEPNASPDVTKGNKDKPVASDSAESPARRLRTPQPTQKSGPKSPAGASPTSRLRHANQAAARNPDRARQANSARVPRAREPDVGTPSGETPNRNLRPEEEGLPDTQHAHDDGRNHSARAGKKEGSDKNKQNHAASLKDKAEDKAADAVMDATPGLSQFNNARKVLKNYNKAKKAAGGEEGLSDKVEEKMDDAVDKGKKGAKIAAGVSTAAPGAAYGAGMWLLMKLLMMLRQMLVAALKAIVGFFAGIIHAISSFFMSVLGVGAAVGNAIAAGVIAAVVAVASLFSGGIISSILKDGGSSNVCTPSKTKVSDASQDYVNGGGEASAMQKKYATQLYSVYSKMGASKTQVAAVLGNLQAESGLDPTAVETIYDEPFIVGPKKMAAANAQFRISSIDAGYASQFPAITYAGIGLGQWTNGRNQALMAYAKKTGGVWSDFNTQIKFMLAGDDAGHRKVLTNFLKENAGNIDQATEKFMNKWEGLSSPNGSLATRQKFAKNYMFILDQATVDTSYADSILNGLNVNNASANESAGAYYQDDGCGNPIATHYSANKEEDGTGQVPSDLKLVPWSRETLPDSLKKYYYNPEDAGLSWGNAKGWAEGVIPDQCVALATSYFELLYPDWNKKGRPTTRPYGDGKDTAKGWADHYGQKTTDSPAAGAVFSTTVTSSAGHTGIVQHVFANGDILICEQNVRGVSGEEGGLKYSWSWRVIKKSRYTSEKWVFFKPEGETPQWSKTGA